MASLPRTIREATVRLSEGGLSKKELVELTFSRIHAHRHLNAFTFIPPKSKVVDGIRETKNGGTEEIKKALDGVIIAVKDNYCVEGMPATCGSKMLYGFMPPYTATVVQKLINAGAIIIGKTNMDEFGMGNGTVDSVFGPTKNIWGLEKYRCSTYSFDDWHVPGGSSGGSAVAVAAGLCQGYKPTAIKLLEVALGSDTGGSTRNPASYCGVYGLKPTYGTVSRYGLIPLVNSMDVPGIMSKTVEDCAVIYDSIKGWDPLDSTTVKVPTGSSVPSIKGNVKGLKIGIPKEYFSESLSTEVAECWKRMADTLENEGASVVEVSLPHTKYSIVCYSVLNPCEVASNMARYDGLQYGHRSYQSSSTEALFAQTRHEGFNSVVRGRILAGNYFLLKSNYDKYFLQALKLRRLISNDFTSVWEDGVDLLLTPVTLTTAPEYSEFTLWDNRKQSSVQDYCTQPANMAGLPALSIPIKLSKTGLPLSLQLIGPRFSETLMFEVTKYIENVVNFQHTHSLNTSD